MLHLRNTLNSTVTSKRTHLSQVMAWTWSTGTLADSVCITNQLVASCTRITPVSQAQGYKEGLMEFREALSHSKEIYRRQRMCCTVKQLVRLLTHRVSRWSNTWYLTLCRRAPTCLRLCAQTRSEHSDQYKHQHKPWQIKCGWVAAEARWPSP